MDEHAVFHWVDAYEVAWGSNDPEQIGALFTEDAVYYTAPFGEPWRGREAIVAGWLENRDEYGTWDFDEKVLAVAGDLAFVQGETVYLEPTTKTYHNLWVIRLDGEGRCSEFTEWWMLAPEPPG